MLSLPLIPPRADATLWPTLRTTPTTFDTDPPTPHPPHRRNGPSAPSRSLFTALLIDENKQRQRNANIRHFGASWIRPPGIHKTYQAMMDEEKEMKEQEELAAREQQLLDLAAAQQDAAGAEAREEAGDEIERGERDLDDDVPEAEGSETGGSVMSGSEDEEEAEESSADLTFNEDSFIEGSMIEGRVGQMLAMEEASMEGSLLEERDLDDDVPEAGEYEHTDSSLIASSEDEDASFAAPGSRRTSTRSARSRTSSGLRSVRRTSGFAQANTHAHAHSLAQAHARAQMQNRRASVELEGSSSIMEGSSLLRSSPAAGRGNVRARLFGARAQR